MPAAKEHRKPEPTAVERYDTAVEDAASSLAQKPGSTLEERHALAEAVMESAEESFSYLIGKLSGKF